MLLFRLLMNSKRGFACFPLTVNPRIELLEKYKYFDKIYEIYQYG